MYESDAQRKVRLELRDTQFEQSAIGEIACREVSGVRERLKAKL